MKLLVIGGQGMAGHMIVQYFQKQPSFEVKYTTRSPNDGIFFDAMKMETIDTIIKKIQPDYVINAIGLLNDRAENNQLEAIQVNSLFPHFLKRRLDETGGKLIHISTDCVFLGQMSKEMTNLNREGRYTEKDTPDGQTIYARTKFLGEVHTPPHITIRTSIIGPELKDGIGLFHWFMKQKGDINGYTNVYWNGVTSLQLAKAIHNVIEEGITGLYHLTAPEVISKYHLLKLIQHVFQKQDVVIHPFEDIKLDRTLRNTRDEKIFVPPYDQMIQELYEWMKHHE
ncbi:SDR family oxidoreductase [Caldibacillus thermolactis]|uniref:dTDP-4-dehydrorhamnose reductase n=1 Tax=Pallidibacillus thermolactis TaxID=251051 RepID=A0ABT2WHD6_9BACI|nr:SDR family oxidoreductase [Pallidibacillus thermolactis]MCU9594837.1 SDR family oxidoreductase [Pallidibacillus thermolactis]MCU9602427.1 SDR family oxidoreductase [Pallidibacillus thermolactis subsp. kokeshiiformis]MED1674269.1 SDR family oxidoreductase [Pallidibacillus thermolactis subsp. kokeshiiformis]